MNTSCELHVELLKYCKYALKIWVIKNKPRDYKIQFLGVMFISLNSVSDHIPFAYYNLKKT
jgi:hypothetical protein